MEAPEYYENTRLADVFARDAAHMATLAALAGTITIGLDKVALISERSWTVASKARDLHDTLVAIQAVLQAESNTYRSKNAA